MESKLKKGSFSQDENVKKLKSKFNFRKLKMSLKYRPDIFKYILKLRHCIRIKNKVIAKYKTKLEELQNTRSTEQKTVRHTSNKCEQNSEKVYPHGDSAWDVSSNNDKIVSIADQVKEAAQNAMAESGMVYVESVGMYYDYKTGYYYNSELGLYYHSSTGCYYAYSDDNKTFTFHSYADNSKFLVENEAHAAHEKKKSKKHKKDNEDDAKNQIRKKRLKHSSTSVTNEENNTRNSDEVTKADNELDTDKNSDESVLKPELSKKDKPKNHTGDLEDGECSQTGSEFSESNTSTATISDDDSVARNHPPCMRIIVRETNLSKLKVGTLFLVTKDGGTIGREGDTHTALLKDNNVSRNHLDIRYDNVKRAYFATDLGSKNGTILNGTRMSQSQEISFPMEVPHGSILQVGETKLLCHIHLGNDTCGHCEPGLVMAADEEEKQVAYTRTCSVQKQHQLELARLKNKYAPEPLAIEDASYNDRAKARREKYGSSHDAEKTQQSDLETTISSENKGFQLLKKMGWSKGEGLGKDNQGDTEPVPLVSNESKAGLGAPGSASSVPTMAVGAGSTRPMRLATRARPLRPPASVFRDPLEEDDD